MNNTLTIATSLQMLSIEAFRLAGILSKTLAIGEKKKNIRCVTKTLNIYHLNSASKQHSHSWLFSPSVGPSPSFFFVHQRPQQPEKLKIFFSYFTKYDATKMLCCHNKFVSFSISHCLVYESMIIENSRILLGFQIQFALDFVSICDRRKQLERPLHLIIT